MEYKTGIGYDIHRLVEGRKLIIGGIQLDYPKGLLGHSDGDVLLHAISDALLGALSEADIGTHFPDSDPKYKGIDSAILLKNVASIVKQKGYKVNNIDSVVILEEPKLTDYKKLMQKRIAEILEINEDMIAVKAKTNEGLGDIGRKEAIAAYALISLIGSIGGK